jgi:hypothetical protein
MRSLTFFLLLAGTLASAHALQRVTVAQLEQEVIALRGKPDNEAARQLSDLELTERLSARTFAALQPKIPGSNSQQALLILADRSMFLSLPPAEVPQTPAPDLPTQRRMLMQTIHYVIRTTHELPNFLASRVTTRFEDALQENMQGESPSMSYSYQPLHLVGTSELPVVFRDGQEAVDLAGKSKKKAPVTIGLTSRGEFGPLLFTVLLDITHGTVQWSHWELNLDKSVAIFSFTVPHEQSHYQVGASSQFPGYHGQIALDPTDGTVFRVMVQADVRSNDLISRADIVVEYGPVEIGGRSYICPVRSVAILVDNAIPTSTAQSPNPVQISPTINGESLPPHRQVQLDDTVFTQYHLFRAESRVVVDGKSDK